MPQFLNKQRRISMSKQNKTSAKALYEQQEQKISTQSDAFIRLLTQRGILEDHQIDDDRIRQAQKEKKRNMYHNTQLLLNSTGISPGRWNASQIPWQKNLTIPLRDWISFWRRWMWRWAWETRNWKAGWRVFANPVCC